MVTLGVGLVACGSGHRKPTSPYPSGALASAKTSTPKAAVSELEFARADRDKDNDSSPSDDRSNSEILDYGHAASATDERAIAALIERYYTVATAERGATACSMLYVTLTEAVAEDYGRGSAGPGYLKHATTCPEVMTLLFQHDHARLVAELPLLRVSSVRLRRHQGLAVLSFGPMPERQISVRRERHTWKIENLLDSELP